MQSLVVHLLAENESCNTPRFSQYEKSPLQSIWCPYWKGRGQGKKAGADLALCTARLVYWFQEDLITCRINILLPCSHTGLFTSVCSAGGSLPDGAWLHSFGSDLPISCYPICCRVTWSLAGSAALSPTRSYLLHLPNLSFSKYPLTWQNGNCISPPPRFLSSPQKFEQCCWVICNAWGP